MTQAKFIDRTGQPPHGVSPEGYRASDVWPPITVTGEEIMAEVDRLAGLPAPHNGRREVQLVHPRATEPGYGFAPGIGVTLSVLLPGEATAPVRHNSTQVNFCIRGSGHTQIAGRTIPFGQYHVWNHPSYLIYSHVNDSDEVQVRLTYSNAPLLEMMRVHLVEENPDETIHPTQMEETGDDPSRRSPYGTFQLSEDGAR
ncbi:MAG: hypothetical protein ACE363_02950 [Alphaproteobacteria bacterium]